MEALGLEIPIELPRALGTISAFAYLSREVFSANAATISVSYFSSPVSCENKLLTDSL